jgi:DNA-binding transcriptional LysR family regulator
MDRLDELQVFLAIVEGGSLAAAARKLRRSPPAVTRILNSLEERVGARLLERSTRSLTATEAGSRLSVQARAVLADYESAIAEQGGAQVRGMLKITAPVAFGRRHVAPLVVRFLQLHPAIRAELILADHNVDLIENGIDAALRIGSLPDSSMVARRLGEVRRLTVASPAYLARCGTPRTPADLAGHDTILSTTTGALPEWRFWVNGANGANGREVAVRLTPRLQLDDVEALVNTARDGFGIARPLSYQVALELASGALVRLLQPYEPAPLPVHLVMPSARYVPPRLRAFVDFTVEACAALEVIRPM